MNIWRCLSDWKEGNNTHYVMVQSPKLLKPAMCLVSLIDLYLYKKTFETHEVFFFQCKVPFLSYHNWRMSKESLLLISIISIIKWTYDLKVHVYNLDFFFHHLMFIFIQWLSCIRKVPLPSRQLSSLSLLARFYVA